TASLPASARTPHTMRQCCAQCQPGTHLESADPSTPADAAPPLAASLPSSGHKPERTADHSKSHLLSRLLYPRPCSRRRLPRHLQHRRCFRQASVCHSWINRGTAYMRRIVPPVSRLRPGNTSDPPASTSCGLVPSSRMRFLRCRTCG